jgi:predicted FMN-binding regulatory protein PaiB
MSAPDWYEDADQVPTWNYVSVEVEGPIAILDEAGLVKLLDDLSAQEEGGWRPSRRGRGARCRRAGSTPWCAPSSARA